VDREAKKEKMSNLQSVGAHIDYIRELIRQTSDDTNYPDELIYRAILSARSLLLHREANKYKPWSTWNYQSFCLPLEKATYHDCDCVPDVVNNECIILKSCVEIPRPIRSHLGEIIRITSLDGQTRYYEKTPDQGKYNKYRTTNKTKPFWTVVNGNLAFFNVPDNCWKSVLVTGVFEDPSELDNTLLCEASEGTNCFSIELDDFPVDPYLTGAMYDLTLKKLGIAIQMVDDDSNDASQDNVKRQ
jgi:hypothetical protein